MREAAPRHFANWTRVTVPVLAVALTTACAGSAGEPADVPQYQYDDAMNAAVIEVSQGGDAVPVSDATSLEWDEVALFSEGATLDEIEAVVGPTSLQGSRFTSTTNLLVFRQDGEPVALRGTSADAFAGEYAMLLGADAVIAPADQGAGLVVLRDAG